MNSKGVRVGTVWVSVVMSVFISLFFNLSLNYKYVRLRASVEASVLVSPLRKHLLFASFFVSGVNFPSQRRSPKKLNGRSDEMLRGEG